jgi:hypothetical protein
MDDGKGGGGAIEPLAARIRGGRRLHLSPPTRRGGSRVSVCALDCGALEKMIHRPLSLCSDETASLMGLRQMTASRLGQPA